MVFKLDTTGKETVPYTFTGGTDGGSPVAGVVRDAAGNFYGTTYSGGGAKAGVVYKANTRYAGPTALGVMKRCSMPSQAAPTGGSLMRP